jgi:glycosyltransferase involved in cell wall biosynthesis
MADDLAAHFKLPRRRLLVLPNPIDGERIRRLADQPASLELPGAGPHVVTLGRLAPVKGLDRLLNALPALIRRRPDARLWIVGQGPLQAQLERLAGRLQVADHVRFVGFQRNPYRWLRAADLLVVSSQYESCPNVLLEAVAVGCPPVVLEHPGGTRELLDHLGLADRFVPRLEPWRRAWFQSLPGGAVERLERRHAAASVARQYAAVLQGSSPAAALAPLPPRLVTTLSRAGETI